MSQDADLERGRSGRSETTSDGPTVKAASKQRVFYQPSVLATEFALNHPPASVQYTNAVIGVLDRNRSVQPRRQLEPVLFSLQCLFRSRR